MSGIRKAVRRIVIEVEGDLEFPSPSAGLVGELVSLSLDTPSVSGFRASMTKGQASEITLDIKCKSAEVTILPVKEKDDRI